MEGFSLSKAYLDVVDAAGRCAISYRARLAWGPFALGWEALSLFEPGRPPVHRSAWTSTGKGRGEASSTDQKVGGYTSDRHTGDEDERDRPSRLGLRVSREPWCAPFAARLLETQSGTLDWSCDAAGADVALETEDGIAIRGAGYAEHLELNMLPWKLPIAELRWGRWHCPEARHSITWIDWRGERPLTLVLENGTPRNDATVGDASIGWDDRSLCLGSSPADGSAFARAAADPPERLARGGGKVVGDTCRASSETLYSRTLAEIVRGARPLVERLPPSWRALEDRKSLSRGVLGAESGWAIHEMVRFP